MRKDGSNILITLEEWQAAGLTYFTYKADKRRGYLQTANRGCYGTGVEIIWQSIAKEERKKAIIAVYGNPSDICTTNQLAGWITPDTAAQQFYTTHTLPDGRHLPAERIDEYIANAQVLNAITRAMNDRKGTKRAMGGSVTGILATLADAANRLNRNEYPHSLPTNERRLRDVLSRYRAEGYAGLIHKSYMNKYAAKVDNEDKSAIMLRLLCDGRHLDNEQIATTYNLMADKMGWKPVTASAVGVWRKKHRLEVDYGTHGAVAFSNRHTMQIKRQAPQVPLLYWTMDGWTVELLYQRTETVEIVKKRQKTEEISISEVGGKTATTYHNRLTVVIVLDPCEKYPIGYAIGRQENNALIKEVLRNAMRHTAELFGGKMYRSHQLQSDNYHISSLKPLYGVVADKVTPARVHNAKAKVVEPYNHYLNKTYCQFQPNWSGFNVTARKESQPNTEELMANKKNFPDEAGCRAQIVWMMEAERAKKRERYLQRWADVPESDRLEMATADFLYYFGEQLEHKSMLEGAGVTPTIGGVERFYECFDLNFRNHYGTRWNIRYDPDDLSQTVAFNDDATLRFLLERKYVQPMALKERCEGDAAAKKRVDDFNRALVERVGGRVNTLKRELPVAMPVPELEILERMCIPDSRGQHKDRRNAARELPPVEDVEPVLVLANGQPEDDNETNPFDLY